MSSIEDGYCTEHAYRKEKREATFTEATGSAFLGSFFEKINYMTAEQETLVRLAKCPLCIPREGQQSQMQLLGDFGPLRGYQCPRCNTVWITNPPNDKLRDAAT